jgi:hypothetical protein
LDEVADELYGLPPEEFVGRRRQLAAQARQAGYRTLAAAVTKLARPTTSAWLVNVVVRAETARVGELLELGAGLRDAQAHLDADELRRLAARRQAAVAALGRLARGLAADRGHPAGSHVTQEFEQTLAAALADPAAAEAVRSGRLTRPLRHVGLGPVELAGAVAAAAGGAQARPRPPRAEPAAAAPPGRVAGTRPGVGEDRRRQPERGGRRRRDDLRAARDALAAEEDTAQARRRLDEHTAAAEAARGRAADLQRRVGELAADLDRARRDAAEAAADAEAAERRRAEAVRDVERAEQQPVRAQADLDRHDHQPAPADTDQA